MMKYAIRGGNPLSGEVTIGGAKNAALGIIVAAIMANEPVTIENIPDVDDVKVLLEAIETIGAIVERIDESTVRINGALINDTSVDRDAIRKIRGSYYLVGALLGKYKKALVLSYRIIIFGVGRKPTSTRRHPVHECHSKC